MADARRTEAAFLRGGDAMGALIAKHDWASTPLGPLETWPASLKTATAIILRSPLPMAILVGEEGVTVYNDAYATLLGRRHPETLGAKARECAPEVADLSDQAIRAGLAGRTLTFRDLPMTICRTGQPEQVWMNVDCSPLLDADGRPLGVLSLTIETTERVLAERKAAVEIARLRAMFEQAPGFICLLSGPELIVEFTNETHKRLFGARPEGTPYLEAFADMAAEGEPEILLQVYATGQRYVGRAAPVRVPSPGGRMEKLYVDVVIEAVRDDDGAIIGLYVEGFDVTAQVRAQQAAEENARRLSAAVSVAQLGTYQLDLETGEATLDARARAIFGFQPGEDLRVSAVVARIDPDDLVRLQAEARAAEAAGQTRREHDCHIRLPDGAIRNIATVCDAIPGPDGRIRHMVGLFDDVTERRRAEKRQRLLINELNHRVKNTLATVQSMAAQTLRSAPDLLSARESFEARLVALAAAHDLLTAQSWNGARLSDVVAAAMAPFETVQRPQIGRSGPPAWLSAQRALALSLALHELGTNASKYGALSHPDGHVTISWSQTAAGELALSWVEQGGPAVETPVRTGFGTRLLQRNLARELDGKVAFAFAPDGVRCEIRCKIDDVRAAAAPSNTAV